MVTVMNSIADVLIVTVTKIESRAVIDVFQGISGQMPEPISIGDRMYHNLGMINGARVFITQSEMGAGGLGSSLLTVHKGIAALSPIAVVMVGIAFGVNPEKQSIGDVLVSRQILEYEPQRVGTEKGILSRIPRGDRPHASPWLIDRFRNADLYRDKPSYKVHFGLILSGEKLVDNLEFRQQLCELEPEAIGGEMEGAGLYVACQDAKVDWILVKSICDWADGHKDKNKDNQQQLAAHNAASFVLQVLQHAPLRQPLHAKHHPLFSLVPQTNEFIGRDAEKHTLQSVVNDHQKRIIWIGGISGIGKTYLAAWLYQKLSENDNSLLLWVDCQKKSVTLEILLDALAEVSGDSDLIKSIGHPSSHLSDRIEQVLLKFMEPKKAILFLEDYHRLENLDKHNSLDEFLVQVALYSKQVKIVLIGQIRPHVFDNPKLRGTFFDLQLNGLAVEYTREFVGIPALTNKQTHAIWKNCADGTPVAMFLFSTAAKRSPLSELLMLPLWDVDETTPQWLEPILKNLTSSEFQCLQAASVLRAHIPFKTLEYLYSGDDLNLTLARLQNRGLLDHEPGSDNWHFRHDIIRDYVREKKITPVDRIEFDRRIALYYARFVLENINDSNKLYSESTNILGAVDWYRRKQQGTSNTITTQLQISLDLTESAVIPLIYVISELANWAGDTMWAIDLCNEAIDLARIKKEYPILAKALKQMAHLTAIKGDIQSAIRQLREAVEIGRLAGEKAWDTRLTSCDYLGGLLIDEGRNRYPLAEQYVQEGLKIAKQTQDYIAVARLVGKLAYIYREKEFEKAYAFYQDERINLTGVPLAILLLGIIPRLTELERFNEAKRCIHEARNIFVSEHNLGGIAYTWRLQGNWYWEQDRLDLAEECFHEEERLRHLAVKEKGEDMYHLREALSLEHWFYHDTGQLEKAEQCRIKYQAIQSESDWVPPQMLGREADLLNSKGNFKDAFQRCQEAIMLLNKQNDLGIFAWLIGIQADSVAGQGKYKAAEQLYEEMLQARIPLNEPNFTGDDLKHIAKFYLEQMGDTGQACEYLQRALQEYQLVDAKKASAVKEELRDLQSL